MKKITCFFMILTQAFLFSSYAVEQTASAEATNAQPEVAPITVSPAVQEAPKAEEVKAPVVQKEAIKEQPAKKGNAKCKKARKEETKEMPCKAPQDAQGKVILRERASDQNPLRKVARGAVNTTLGWVEIPRQMIKVNREQGDIAGVFWGPLKGFAFFVGRTAVGVYEVTTFLLPPYKPVVNPEFILADDDND